MVIIIQTPLSGNPEAQNNAYTDWSHEECKHEDNHGREEWGKGEREILDDETTSL